MKNSDINDKPSKTITTNIINVDEELSIHTKKTIKSGKSLTSNQEKKSNKSSQKLENAKTPNKDNMSDKSGCVGNGCGGGGFSKVLNFLKFWESDQNKEEKNKKQDSPEQNEVVTKIDEETKSPEKSFRENINYFSNDPESGERINQYFKNQSSSPLKGRTYDCSDIIGEIADEENFNEEEKDHVPYQTIYKKRIEKKKETFKDINKSATNKNDSESNGEEGMYRVKTIVSNDSDMRTKMSASSFAKSLLSKRRNKKNLTKGVENDIENLIEKEDFPCQINDYVKLSFDLDEMDLFYQTFSISEITQYHLEKNEEICCLMEGLYWKEKDKGDRVFLIITTLKLMVLSVITETTVSVSLTIFLRDIETVFFTKDKFYIVLNSGNDKIKLLFEMGYKNHDSDKDYRYHKTPEKNIENTFLFIVTLWRMKFISNQTFLRVIRVSDLRFTDVKLQNNNYLFDMLKKIQENSILKEIKNILTKKNIKNGIKVKKLKKSEDQICYANYLLKNKNKSIEFTNPKHGYCLVIIKILFEHLVIYDFINDDLCYIELANIVKVAINQSRLLIIIYFQNEKDFQKIVLYTHKQGDEEFELFKPIYVFLIEANRRKNLNFEFWTGNFEVVYTNNVLNEDWEIYDLVKNSHKLKTENEIDLEAKKKAEKLKHNLIIKKQDLEAKYIHVPVVEYTWCCQKKENTNDTKKDEEQINGKKKLDLNPEKSSCIFI